MEPTGGVCASDAFHAMLDGMVDYRMEELEDCSDDEVRDLVLLSILMMLTPAGKC